jgi:HAD superfamily hydrolase (TIGR01459 family)
MPQPIEILENCEPFLATYRALICDVWGVVHDGITAYQESNKTLTRYREKGGKVVLLSNSPQTSSQVTALLERKGVWRSVYDSIITSGDLTIIQLRTMQVERVYHIGPGRHDPLYENQPYRRSSLEEAEIIVCTGFFNDKTEELETYMPDLQKAQARGLPFVCANPDIVVDVGGVLVLCAGAIATRYEALGGKVYWAGKPDSMAYRAVQKEIDRLCEMSCPLKDILALGDGLRTDIRGAQEYGIDALFIAQGIHRDEVSKNGKINLQALEELFSGSGLKVRAAAYDLK